jgi:hypothetical protein
VQAVVIASILWRRLDAPGHDACRLEQREDGWIVDGAATFSEEGQPAQLKYRVACDRVWRSTRGRVNGWIGPRAVDIRIERSSEGVWTMNGAPVSDVDSCVDLDLGFTPATNLFQLRRLALHVAESAQQSVAWLDPGTGTLEVVQQRYERRTEQTYWYESPRFDYAALLEISPAGFVNHYPGLWNEERGKG